MINFPIADEYELAQIEILKQINANLCTDIDCLQLRESMLEYKSKTYKMLFDTHPNPTALIRLSDGRLLEANQGFERLLGYTKDEFRAIGIEYFLMESSKKLRNMAKKALKNGCWFQTECTLQSRDKGLIPVSITASLIKHDEETLVQTSLRKL